jgi:hypothetical protein
MLSEIYYLVHSAIHISLSLSLRYSYSPSTLLINRNQQQNIAFIVLTYVSINLKFLKELITPNDCSLERQRVP